MDSERERSIQIRQLHINIKNYQPSPQDSEDLRKAYHQLTKSIQYKYHKSSINQNFKFPRNQPSSQQYQSKSQSVNLFENNNQSPSLNCSIAEEPQTNPIYSSEKINFFKKDTLKIKLFKKKQNLSFHRLKTDYVSSCSNKSKPKNILTDHDNNEKQQSKASQIPVSKINFSTLKEKMKISDITSYPYKLPFNKTMRTEYTPSNKRECESSFDRFKTQFYGKSRQSKNTNYNSISADKTVKKNLSFNKNEGKRMNIKIHAPGYKNKENKSQNHMKSFNSIKTEERCSLLRNQQKKWK